jgi:hypothetical protein
MSLLCNGLQYNTIFISVIQRSIISLLCNYFISVILEHIKHNTAEYYESIMQWFTI